jgi:hypothetical protein
MEMAGAVRWRSTGERIVHLIGFTAKDDVGKLNTSD